MSEDNEQNKMNIYQRMLSIMKAVPYIQKEDKKVNNQYTFVAHDAVTAKLQPALIQYGIYPHVTTLTWECINHKIITERRDGQSTLETFKTKVLLRVTFVNADSPSETIIVDMPGEGIDNQDKGIGKAISYAFKYACLKAFMLETGDDPERHNPEPPESPILDKYRIKRIQDLVKEINPSEASINNPEMKWLAWAYAAVFMDESGSNLAKLSDNKADALIEKLKKYLDDLNAFQKSLQDSAAQDNQDQ